MIFVRALELAEQGIELSPVIWRDGEAAVLARDDVLCDVSMDS